MAIRASATGDLAEGFITRDEAKAECGYTG
jgi:hypothetical protein